MIKKTFIFASLMASLCFTSGFSISDEDLIAHGGGGHGGGGHGRGDWHGHGGGDWHGHGEWHEHGDWHGGYYGGGWGGDDYYEVEPVYIPEYNSDYYYYEYPQ